METNGNVRVFTSYSFAILEKKGVFMLCQQCCEIGYHFKPKMLVNDY